MIHQDALSESFFDLKTKEAGSNIQKFVNYGIKAGAIISQGIIQNERFKEMVLEIKVITLECMGVKKKQKIGF